MHLLTLLLRARHRSQRIFKGYVVGWRAIAAQSAVPALYWYVDDAEKARGDEATPGSLAFDAGDGQLRYYDQVEVHRQGSGRHDGDVRQINAAVKSKDWVSCQAKRATVSFS